MERLLSLTIVVALGSWIGVEAYVLVARAVEILAPVIGLPLA
jgi:hypothetical protein